MARKRRRNARGGNRGCLIAVIAVLAILLICATMVFLWVKNEVDGKRGDAVTQTVIIDKGSGPLTIGKVLTEKGIIRNAQIFRLYARQSGKAETLQYGEFELSSDMSYDEIIEALQSTSDDRDTVRVTFPEGIPAVQFAQRMEDAGLCSAEEFLEVANTGDFSQFGFWSKREENPDQFMAAEGYLFPDTYDFFVGDSVYNMVAKIYGEFDSKMTDEMYAQINAMGFTLSEFITLVSIVQEEAGGVEHQADVAAIFMNRLADNSIVSRLESNTSSYITNPDDNNYLFNTVAQYYGGWESIPQNIIDAYDTYKKEGLPAGPISNPGLDAMQNTLKYKESVYADPNDPYYFFVTDLAGTYYFGRTANEHAANCEKAWAVNAQMGY